MSLLLTMCVASRRVCGSFRASRWVSLLLNRVIPLKARLFFQVRVIDKKLQGGRLYLKKGQVADVHPGCLADVTMDDDGQSLQVCLSFALTGSRRR